MFYQGQPFYQIGREGISPIEPLTAVKPDRSPIHCLRHPKLNNKVLGVDTLSIFIYSSVPTKTFAQASSQK